MLSFRARVDQGAMAIPQKLQHRLVQNLGPSLEGNSYPSAEVQSVYSSAQLTG